MPDNLSKIFIDTGNGFSDEAVLFQSIPGDEKSITFDVLSFGRIRIFCFEPINDYCVVRIHRIIVKRKNHTAYELDNLHSNAVEQRDGLFLFGLKTPKITGYLFGHNIESVTIFIDYLSVGADSIDTILKSMYRISDAVRYELTKTNNRRVSDISREMMETNAAMHVLRRRIDRLDHRAYPSGLNGLGVAIKGMRRRVWPLQSLLDTAGKLKRTFRVFPYILSRQYKRVLDSGLFDAGYYRKQIQDQNYRDVSLLSHYFKKGAPSGKNPHPLFNTLYYLDQSPDIEMSGIEPFSHYLGAGFTENRDPNPFFDSSYYLTENPDVADAGMNPLVHYVQSGAKEGRNPGPFFETEFYLKNNPVIKNTGTNPLVHYLETGVRKGNSPSSLFEKLAYKPKVSIITPVYNVDEKYLHKCIRSVLNQVYSHWELCLIDDGSTQSHIKPILEAYSDRDLRINVTFLNENQGIAAASNTGISVATGDFLGFLDHDDELSKDALYEVVKKLNRVDADIIYSDEDVISREGRCLSAVFKPDFSPDLLFSYNYITHFLVVRRKLVEAVDGFSSALEGAQDYDLILKLTDKTKKIVHIPKILYHWRSIAASTSADPNSKSYAHASGQAALESALNRKKIKADVLPTDKLFYYHVKRRLAHHPLVSIIIPFRDEPEHLKKCIDAILVRSTYRNFEIIGINNDSREPETIELISNMEKKDHRVRFHGFSGPFNYSKVNNYGVCLANGEHVTLMNNDVEIENSDWIESLLEHSQRDDVGAVGAKLYYPNNTIQHAGIIIGIRGFAGHSHKNYPREDRGYYSRLVCVQNVSAVTGALMMVKKRLYEELGGLDEDHLAISLNDVDFCLRLRKRGYLNIFTPFCEAIHYESVSRGYEGSPDKKQRFSREIHNFQRKWKALLELGDPYYNPNLTLNREDFSIIKSQKKIFLEKDRHKFSCSDVHNEA